jgi:hypothetical protein
LDALHFSDCYKRYILTILTFHNRFRFFVQQKKYGPELAKLKERNRVFLQTGNSSSRDFANKKGTSNEVPFESVGTQPAAETERYFDNR